MIGGVTRLGGLPGLPGRVTLSAGVAFCHVNDSRWGNPPSRGRVHARQSAPKFEPEQYGRPRLQTRRAFFAGLILHNVQQSEENQAYSGIVSEEDPMESHTSTVNNFTLPSRPSIAQAAQGKRKASENKEQSTVPKKTKNPKNKAWNKNNGIYNTQHSQKTARNELNLNPVVLERSKEE